MKRIAAHIGLTTFCALAVAFYLPENITAVTVVCLAVAAVLFLLFKKTRKHIGVIVIVVTAALFRRQSRVYRLSCQARCGFVLR